MPRTMTVANFARLSIEAVRARAERDGFVRDRCTKSGRAVVMGAPVPSGAGEVEFLLPLDAGIADYVSRMVDAVAALAIVEGAEPLDVLRELLTVSEQTPQ